MRDDWTTAQKQASYLKANDNYIMYYDITDDEFSAGYINAGDIINVSYDYKTDKMFLLNFKGESYRYYLGRYGGFKGDGTPWFEVVGYVAPTSSTWSSKHVRSTRFTVVDKKISYYTNDSSSRHAGYLLPGTTIEAEYNPDTDTLYIISCSDETIDAVGKCIKNPTENGATVLLATDKRDWGRFDVDYAYTLKVNGYLNYYRYDDSDGYQYHGRLKDGDVITIDLLTERPYTRYITGIYDNGSITTWHPAYGKYILSPTNENDEVMLTTIVKTYVTTEATSEEKNDDPLDNTDHSAFSTSYGTRYTSVEDYRKELDGLMFNDLRAILGIPHQFLPITDTRIDSESIGDVGSFGRVYSDKIIKHIPLLLMTPGKPIFMESYSKSQQVGVIAKALELTTETLQSIMGTDTSGKYYSLEFSFTEYFYYVNAMLRSAAFFLEIDDVYIDGSRLGYKNWLYYTSDVYGEGVYSHGKLGSFLGPHSGCVAFYADAGTTVDDSFSNSTTDSQLASMVNTVSDKGRELNFLLGNVGGQIGLKADFLSEDSMTSTTDLVNKLLDSDNIINQILNKGTTLIGGGRMIFPEIWQDSSFSRSYSCSMKLVSPSGDNLSIFLNILVPIYHLLAFTLPRETTGQSYFSPFLVRAYYKGLFNVDMGIITSLSITKGDEGEWTTSGIPTVANVSFEIKDLYDGMSMSKQKEWGTDRSIMSNITELDYIANSCGINVNDQDIWRTVNMAGALGFSSLTDMVTIGIFGEIKQWLNQKIQNIFGVF